MCYHPIVIDPMCVLRRNAELGLCLAARGYTSRCTRCYHCTGCQRDYCAHLAYAADLFESWGNSPYNNVNGWVRLWNRRKASGGRSPPIQSLRSMLYLSRILGRSKLGWSKLGRNGVYEGHSLPSAGPDQLWKLNIQQRTVVASDYPRSFAWNMNYPAKAAICRIVPKKNHNMLCLSTWQPGHIVLL